MLASLETCWEEERAACAGEVPVPALGPVFRCWGCDLVFATLPKLRAHLRSAVHLGGMGGAIECLFCARSFGSAAGAVAHLEQGCPGAPHVNGRTIFRCLRQLDRHGYATNVLLALQPAVLRVTYANRQDMFRCTACGIEVTAPQIVKQHIRAARESAAGAGRQQQGWGLVLAGADGADKNQRYRCPDTRGCDEQFGSLGAAVAHIEGGRCALSPFTAHSAVAGHEHAHTQNPARVPPT